MDANGQRFWLLADARHWPGREHVEYLSTCRALRLAGERELGPGVSDAASIAASALERLPRSVDRLGAVAAWNQEAMAILVRSYLPEGSVTLTLPERPQDFALGFDDLLYVALNNRVLVHDLRGRWSDQVFQTPEFQVWRMTADPQGGVWALERASGRLARLRACINAARPAAEYDPGTFRPDGEYDSELNLQVLDAVAWDDDERPRALAMSGDRRLALLSWRLGGESRIRLLDQRTGRLGAAHRLRDARFSYALDWLPDARLVVRVPGRHDAPVFVPQMDTDHTNAVIELRAAGDIYPLAAQAEEGPFAHRVEDPPQYPLQDGSVQPLHRLSIARLARRGIASNSGESRSHLIDSGEQTTVWHRLYAEARLPAGCGMTIWLSATAEPQAPPEDQDQAWHPHVFGEVSNELVPLGPLPSAAWERQPSELPGHPGLGAWGQPEQGRSGLWNVLIQRNATRVRALTGRYLWCRVELHGDGSDSPELAALRAYASRFSYRDQYLPGLYRETEFGAAAERPGDRVLALAAGLASELDGGETLPATLRQQLGLGEAARLRVLEAGARWEVGEGSAKWALQLESAGEGGAASDEIGVYAWGSTQADFLERYLGNVEAWLTPLEDRVASAHLASDPDQADSESLDWLASWIGVAFDPVLPEAYRRDWLKQAPELARFHGTLHGLRLALEIASGGAVSSGEIIVLEGFRLRRLLATLLGVNLNDPQDPLLPGLVISGNSVVGDTLVLGETESSELLALFRDEVASEAERQSVLAFYERLAYRALILVHQDVEAQDFGLIRRIVEMETPAHVETQVEAASWPLLVGIASLVGVDTYLRPGPERRPARANRTELGNGDFVVGVGSLDPRLSGSTPPLPGGSPPPTADAGPDFQAAHGSSFQLDGSGSRAAPGRSISEYRWLRRD